MSDLSIQVQPRDSGWITLGTGHRFQVVPESIMFDGDSSEYGCLSASWLMRIDPRFNHYDLEHFTPVVIMDGILPIWSGRIIATPTTFGEEGIVRIEAQGWGQHLKDDCIDKVWQSIDLSKWLDARTFSTAPLASFTQKGNVQNDGQIMLAWQTATVMAEGDWVGVMFDAGPNNLISDWSVDYLSSNNTPYAYLYVMGDSSPSLTTAVYNSIGGTSIQNGIGASGTWTGRFATPQRYVILLVSNQAAYTPGADVYFKITGARVATSAVSLGGTLASNIIKDTLTACCPLISSDQSKITATTFAIPEFYT